MKRMLVPAVLALILSAAGYRAMAQAGSGAVETRMSPACGLAVSAALTDLRKWYADAHPGRPEGFDSYLQQSYGVVACDEIGGRRITVEIRGSTTRGGGVSYKIDAVTFSVIERVLGR